MSTPAIQLAFQGGGAKLVAMLPIADAFRQAERDGLIAIQRVSGTSAGAICAALIAVQADFAAVRKFLVKEGRVHLAGLVPPDIAALTAKSRAKGGLSFWDIAKHPRRMQQVVLAGNPLLHSAELKRFIAGALAATNGKHPRLIEECPIKLIITASDIVSATGIRHERGDLVGAVEDSCSLPILLRSFGALATTHYVDGGLCDNLPVDCLTSDSHTPIFAVFPEGLEEPRKNKNILNYFVSLLSASINHNVARSIDLVSKPYRFGVQTDIGLLDFEKGIARLADDAWYRISVEDALERIASFSKSYGFTLTPSQSRVADSTDIDQFRSTLLNLTDPEPDQPPHFRGLKGKFVVRINHERRLAPDKPHVRRAPDTITRITQMQVLADGVRFYRTSVNIDEDSIVPTIWSARNLTRKIEIPIVTLPLSPGKFAKVPMRHCLVEFVDHRKHLAEGDIIELQSTYATPAGSDLRKLNMGRPDYFGFSNATGQLIEEAELILVFPKSLGQFRLHQDDQRCRDLTHPATALDLHSNDKWMMDVGQSAVGITIKQMEPNASFYATIIPE